MGLANDAIDLALRITAELHKVEAVFYTEETLEKVEENGDDASAIPYEYPCIFTVGKWGHFLEYSIMSINKGKISAFGLGEDWGEIREFDLSDLNYQEIILLGREVGV